MHIHKCQKTTTTCQMSEFGAEMNACSWNQQVHLQFAESLVEKSSKLELFYQKVKTHEFLKYGRRSRASKALATGRFIHRCMEPVVLDTRPKSKNVEITINPKT